MLTKSCIFAMAGAGCVLLLLFCFGFFFLTMPHSLQDLSSLTKDWTGAQQWNHWALTTGQQGSPWCRWFFREVNGGVTAGQEAAGDRGRRTRAPRSVCIPRPSGQHKGCIQAGERDAPRALRSEARCSRASRDWRPTRRQFLQIKAVLSETQP